MQIYIKYAIINIYQFKNKHTRKKEGFIWKRKNATSQKNMIGIAIVLLVIIILTFRKVVILTSIHNKVVEYEQGENIYYKATYTEAEYERFIKGKVDKSVVNYPNGIKIIQIMDEEEMRHYFEMSGKKTLEISKVDRNNFWISKIPSITDAYLTQGEIAFNSLVSRIHTEKIDGEKYYVIEY